MHEQTHRESFHRLFIENQRLLYAHLFSLLTTVGDVEEVFQATCVVLLDKADQFQTGTDFRAWMLKIAQFEVYNYRRRKQAEGRRFSDTLVEQLAEQRVEMSAELDDRASALRQCIQKLPTADQEIIRQRYGSGISTKKLAQRLGRSAEGLYKSMQRLRFALRRCIERTLAAQGGVQS
jgi:RNA polymerase sigma-70 factor (ECF subfamily)